MDLAPLTLLTGFLLFAAWSDVQSRTLHNWLAVVIFLTAIGGVALNAGLFAILSHLAHSGCALIVGFGLFALGWIGGGDAKIYAATAAAFPASQAGLMLVSVSAAMVILFVFWVGVSRGRHRTAADQRTLEKSDDFAKLPLGVAIAFGGITPLWLTFLR